jgi:SAM-dependent methyltransferase
MDRWVALLVATPPRFGNVIPRRLNRALGAAAVEGLLATNQPRLFAAIGELDWYAHSHRHWIEEQVFRAGDRILEVGCATGALTVYLADRGYRVTGLDRSSDMIRRARNDHPHLDLCVGDAMTLPYDDDTFDAVVAASVINVVPDATQVLSEMHRVCTPGGTISVLVPSDGFTEEDLDSLIETLRLTGFSEAVLTKWHRGPPKMSRSQLKTLFESVGLETLATRTYLDGMLMAATASVRPT